MNKEPNLNFVLKLVITLPIIEMLKIFYSDKIVYPRNQFMSDIDEVDDDDERYPKQTSKNLFDFVKMEFKIYFLSAQNNRN